MFVLLSNIHIQGLSLCAHIVAFFFYRIIPNSCIARDEITAIKNINIFMIALFVIMLFYKKSHATL